jgi:hypothetical protein
VRSSDTRARPNEFAWLETSERDEPIESGRMTLPVNLIMRNRREKSDEAEEDLEEELGPDIGVSLHHSIPGHSRLKLKRTLLLFSCLSQSLQM